MSRSKKQTSELLSALDAYVVSVHASESIHPHNLPQEMDLRRRRTERRKELCRLLEISEREYDEWLRGDL